MVSTYHLQPRFESSFAAWRLPFHRHVGFAVVVQKAEYRAEVFDAIEALSREIAVEISQSVLKNLEPSFDVVALTSRDDHIFESEPSGRPSVQGLP